MKALLVSPEIKKIEEVDIAGEQDIICLIGFDTRNPIASVATGIASISTKNVSCVERQDGSRLIS